MQMKNVMRVKSSQFQGFTLLEMLVAMTVAAILMTVTLNVYLMFQRGIVGTSLHYEHFVSEKVKELRCCTRFVRGLPPCDTIPDKSRAHRDAIRLRF